MSQKGYHCAGCLTKQPQTGGQWRSGQWHCATCVAKTGLSKWQANRRERIEAKARGQEYIKERITAAYRRGFEDGWRESKLEVTT